MSERIKAAFLCNNPQNIDRVYGMGRRERLGSVVDLYPVVITEQNLPDHVRELEGCEFVFSTWGMPVLSSEIIDRLSSLRVVFYAAGSVKYFAAPYLERSIPVVSAWAMNGRPVAAFALAQILLACKGYFRNTRACRDPQIMRSYAAPSGPGIFGARVALIGAGEIGRQLIGLLRPFDIDVVVVDPYLSLDAASELGVSLVSPEEAFSTATVVSNHVPDLVQTRGMLHAGLFQRLSTGATFINTGRGAQVVEDDLIATAIFRPDLTFLLDVTDPEPPAPDSQLYTLPNVQLSSHIAGTIGTEVVYLADCVIDELERHLSGKPFRYAVTRQMLERMA
jgi:phosphoglycerate dehydrogenase-like enzyme